MVKPICVTSGLKINVFTLIYDKLSKVKALHAKWDLEDIESLFENEILEAWQKNWRKGLGMIIFRFVLWEVQINAIWTLFY